VLQEDASSRSVFQTVLVFLSVQQGKIAWLLVAGLNHQVFVQHRRAPHTPIVAHRKRAKISAPYQFAPEVVAIHSLVAEKGDDIGSVGNRCLGGIAVLRVSRVDGFPAGCGLIPKKFSAIRSKHYLQEIPGIRFPLAPNPCPVILLDRCDCGCDEHAVYPHD
jgi:hypothetical protein